MHIKPNDFDKYHPRLKALYAKRDGVKTKEEFDAQIAERLCINCLGFGDTLQPANQPHCEGVCPLAHSYQEGMRLSPMVATRNRKRMENLMMMLPAGDITHDMLMTTAAKLDAESGGSHLEACTYYANRFPDTEPDQLIALAMIFDSVCGDYLE